MAKDNRELDLDIVTTSWRSLSDRDAYGQMVKAWEQKLAVVGKQPRLPLIDTILRRHLDSIDNLLDDHRNMIIEDPLELAVKQLPTPTMVLSPDGLVAALNERAGDYFGVRQGLRAGTEWLRDDSQSDFNAVRQSALGRGNIYYAIVRISVSNGCSAIAEVERLDVEGIEGSYTVVRSLELDWYDGVSSALQKAFGLTRAETEVARLLFAHRDLDRVAEARSAKLETVRTQVKRILSKVEVHSKTELMRLLALLCARVAANHNAKDLTWSDPMGREKFFIRRDGRRLGHSWVGAENGRPILFVPGQTSFNFFPEFIRDSLENEGIKLLVASIPGHGNSDPAPHRDQLLDGCEAIEEWTQSISEEPIPIIATRGAQFYITHLAKSRPELFSFLLLVGLPWNITPKRTETIDKEHLTLMKLSQTSPFAFEVAVRLGYRMVKLHGPDFYWQRGYSHNSADRETVRNIEMLPLLRASVQHIGSQGCEAFIREQEFCARSPISEWVKELKVPFHWMAPGLTIDLTDEDLDEIRYLNPLSTLEVVPNTGELMAFQAPKTFLQRVIDLGSRNPRGTFQARFGKTLNVQSSKRTRSGLQSGAINK